MIRANTRRRLTRDDAQLVVRLIASDAPDERETLEARLADGELDLVLDDPRLPRALLTIGIGGRASLPLFAYVMVRDALRRLGEEDRVLADYSAALFLHFAQASRVHRVAESDDELYSTLAELLEDVNDPDARRSFLVRAHLGNFALWLSGVFPDYIDQRRWRRGGPELEYYEMLGRRGFQLASEHRLASEQGVADLYASVAQRFDRMRLALNLVSDRLLFPNVSSPERLMRQVADEARWRAAG